MADDWFAANAPAEDWFAKNAPPPPAPEKPWIGQPRPENEGVLSSLYHMPVYGLQDIGTGLKHLSTEGTRRQGAHEVFTGLGEASLPAVAAGAVASAPAMGGAGLLAYLTRLGLTLGTGTAGMGLGRAGAGFMGADPETQALVGDAGAVAGGGLPSILGETRIGPVITGMARGAKEGALKKYQTQGGIVPGMVRGAVQAWEQRPNGTHLAPSGAIPPPPGTPAARFVPGQYDAPMPQRPPVEVGGAHIPDYHGPVAGESPLPTPEAPAAASAQALNEVAAKLKATAKNMGAKNFGDLPDTVQKTVIADMVKRGEMPAPPGTLPTPGIIPEGEHNIIRTVAETNRGAKDTAIARSLKDEGITAETFDKMSDVDLQKRVRDLGYRPSTGKNYSRTWQAFKRDLRQLLD